MLQSLYIKDYALIHQLQISFEKGFSVITGETGAGKSIMLGAIGLLLGQRADVKTIRKGAPKCIIEARFLLEEGRLDSFFDENELEYDAECILRREVSTTGKSRAFINDTPVSLSLMKELGEQLIDIHSQHQNLLLGKEDFQLEVLDIVAADVEQLSTYREKYKLWKRTVRALKELKEQIARDKQDEDYVQFQLDQLEEAALKDGEQEELELEAQTLSHAEDIKSGLFKAEQLLISDEEGLLNDLRNCRNSLQNILGVYPAIAELYERLDSSYIELEDIAQEMQVLCTSSGECT